MGNSVAMWVISALVASAGCSQSVYASDFAILRRNLFVLSGTHESLITHHARSRNNAQKKLRKDVKKPNRPQDRPSPSGGSPQDVCSVLRQYEGTLREIKLSKNPQQLLRSLRDAHAKLQRTLRDQKLTNQGRQIEEMGFRVVGKIRFGERLSAGMGTSKEAPVDSLSALILCLRNSPESQPPHITLALDNYARVVHSFVEAQALEGSFRNLRNTHADLQRLLRKHRMDKKSDEIKKLSEVLVGEKTLSGRISTSPSAEGRTHEESLKRLESRLVEPLSPGESQPEELTRERDEYLALIRQLVAEGAPVGRLNELRQANEKLLAVLKKHGKTDLANDVDVISKKVLGENGAQVSSAANALPAGQTLEGALNDLGEQVKKLQEELKCPSG